MTTLTPPMRRRQAAFTLPELLVVIAIIGILVSLTMAAVMRVRASGTRTENFHRIEKISLGISAAKTELNLVNIPSGGFRLRNTYTNEQPEMDILKTAFPRATLMNTGLPDVTLDSNQTLMFFLTGGTALQYKGFSQNPSNPFETASTARKGPWLEITPKLYTTTAPAGLSANGQAWLIDPYGTPYAYFAAVNGKPGAYTNAAYGGGSAGSAFAYKNGGRYVSESGYQIISAGQDMKFGSTGVLPASDPFGMDDVANFSKAALAAGL